MSVEKRLPQTMGLCPAPEHAPEFYMPDPAPGETCPKGHDGDPPEMVLYVPLDAVLEALGREFDLFCVRERHRQPTAVGFIERKFGSPEGER